MHDFVVIVPVLVESLPNSLFDDAAEDGDFDFDDAVAKLNGAVGGFFLVSPYSFADECVGEKFGFYLVHIASCVWIPGADFLPGEHFGREDMLYGFWNLAVGAHFHFHVNFAVRVVSALKAFGVREVGHGFEEVVDVADGFVDKDFDGFIEGFVEDVFGFDSHLASGAGKDLKIKD